jgi:hypothetical protein
MKNISNHRIIIRYSKEKELNINKGISKTLINNNYFKRINQTKEFIRGLK